MSMCDTFTTIRSGMSVGRASMFSSRVTWSSTPPSLTPGASSTPSSSIGHRRLDLLVEADLEEVHVHDLVADGVVLAVLEDGRHRLLGADLHVEQRGAVDQQVAQLPRADLERDRVHVRWRRRAPPGTNPARRRRRASRDPRSERSSTARDGRWEAAMRSASVARARRRSGPESGRGTAGGAILGPRRRPESQGPRWSPAVPPCRACARAASPAPWAGTSSSRPGASSWRAA